MHTLLHVAARHRASRSGGTARSRRPARSTISSIVRVALDVARRARRCAPAASPRPQQLEHRPPAFDLLAAEPSDSRRFIGLHPRATRCRSGVSSTTMPAPAASSRMRSASAQSRRARASSRADDQRSISASRSATLVVQLDARAPRRAPARVATSAGGVVGVVRRRARCSRAGRGRTRTRAPPGVSKSSSIASRKRATSPRRRRRRQRGTRAPGGRARRAGRRPSPRRRAPCRRSPSACGSASAARAAGTRAGRGGRATSASVVKLPSDFDIFSPPTVHHARVQPVPRELVARAFGLRDLVLVVREHEVVAAAVDVEAVAEDLERHRRALDVPAGPARAPRRRPRRLAGLRRLPQREVDRAALALVDLDARAGALEQLRSVRCDSAP